MYKRKCASFTTALSAGNHVAVLTWMNKISVSKPALFHTQSVCCTSQIVLIVSKLTDSNQISMLFCLSDNLQADHLFPLVRTSQRSHAVMLVVYFSHAASFTSSGFWQDCGVLQRCISTPQRSAGWVSVLFCPDHNPRSKLSQSRQRSSVQLGSIA